MEHPARKQRDPAGGGSTPDTGPVEGRFGDGPDSAKPTARLVLWPVRVRAAALPTSAETTKGLLKQPKDRGKHPLDLRPGCAALSIGPSYDSGAGIQR